MEKLPVQQALVYLMVTMSAADSSIDDEELESITHAVQTLPVFEGYDESGLPHAAARCAEILSSEEGLDVVFGLVKSSLPEKYYDTAYALAVEIAAADLDLAQEELRLLQRLKDALDLNTLTSAAIEASARARFRAL